MKLTPAQQRVLRYLGAPGIDRDMGRYCLGTNHRPASCLCRKGLVQKIPWSAAQYRITFAGLEALAALGREVGKV